MAIRQAEGRFQSCGHCAQSKKHCFVYIIVFSLIATTLFSMQCLYTTYYMWICSSTHITVSLSSYHDKCSWLHFQKLPIHRPTVRSSEYGDLTTQSCEPLHPRVVFYNRIFKAASSTMSDFLKGCSSRLGYLFTKDLTEEWENENVSHPVLTRIQSQIARSKRQNRRLMAIAHLYFREDIDSTYINLLREPVARFISHYYYCRSPMRYAHKIKRLKELGHFNVTIEVCLENQYEGCVWNHMTRFFCGPHAFCKTGSDEALAVAKHNMLHYYASVGVMEYLNEFVAVLHERLPDFVLPLPETGMRKKFVTRGVTKKPLNESTKRRIINVNKADIELYEFAKDLFFKQAANCGVEIKN